MQDNSKKKIGAGLAATVVVAFVGIIIVAFVCLMRGEEDAGLNGILGAYIAVFAAIAIGVIVSLWQRLREIRGGEEEEAKKY